MAKIGVYPGAFDPVHKGHIAFCEEALKLGLSKIVLLPERQPRGKQATEFAHRVAMLKLAIGSYEKLEVFELPDPQFTVRQTLPELKRLFGNSLSLLIGSDVVKTLFMWDGAAGLLKEMSLVVALRGNDTELDVESALQKTGQKIKFKCIASPSPHIASRAIRQDGETLSDHLHSGVKKYTDQNSLYR